MLLESANNGATAIVVEAVQPINFYNNGQEVARVSVKAFNKADSVKIKFNLFRFITGPFTNGLKIKKNEN